MGLVGTPTTGTLYAGSSTTATRTGVTANNRLVLKVSYIHTAATAIATPSGWTALETPAPAATYQAGGYYTGTAVFTIDSASAGSNSAALSFTGTAWALWTISEWSGYPNQGVHAHNSSAATTNTSGDTGTTSATTTANALVITAFTPSAVNGASNIGLTNPPTGYTSLSVWQDTSTYLLAGETAYKEVTSTGTQTAAYSWNTADHGEFEGVVVTFYAASSGAVLAGTPAAQATATGALTTAINLAAAPAAAATSTGALTTAIKLAAAAAAQATATGAATTGIPLGAAAAAAATGSGSLTTEIQLAATASAQASATGAATTGIPLAAVPAAVAAATGSLTTAVQLAASPAVVATASASMTTGIPLAGAPAASVSASGSITTSIVLAGSAIASATASAALNVGAQLVAAAQAVAAAAADLTTQIRLAASGAASAIAAGALTTAIPLAAQASGVATASADLTTVPAGMSASSAAVATATGSLTTRVQLGGAVAAIGSAAGDLTTAIRLAAAATCTPQVAGELAGTHTPGRPWVVPALTRTFALPARPRQWTATEETDMQRVAPLDKRSSETIDYDIDCSKLLGPGVTLASVAAVAVEPVTSPALAHGTAVISTTVLTINGVRVPAGQALSLQLSGGAPHANHVPQLYYVRVTCNTSAGDVIEATVPVKVDDYPY